MRCLGPSHGAWSRRSAAEKAELARALGADAVVDHRRSEPADWVAEHTGGKGFDVVFDTVGNENLVRAFAAARLNGQVISIVTQTAVDLTPMHVKGLSLHVVFMLIQMLHGIGRAQHGTILREAGTGGAGQAAPATRPGTVRAGTGGGRASPSRERRRSARS